MMIPNSDPLRRLHTPLVPEIKTEIGAALKAARLKKGQSLEAVSQQTRISKRFLSALEENRFEEFPALAYLRGFLKSYCDYLDLDFEAFWRAIQAEVPAAPAAPAAASKAPAAPPAAAAPAKPHAGKTPEHGARQPAAAPARHDEAPSDSSVPRVLFVAAIAAAGIALWLGRQSPAGKPAARAESTPAALQPAHPATEPRLTIEFRRDAWISVISDGRTLFEGRVPRNAKQEWTGKALELKTPAPDALKLTLNGNSFTLPAPDQAGVYHLESP